MSERIRGFSRINKKFNHSSFDNESQKAGRFRATQFHAVKSSATRLKTRFVMTYEVHLSKLINLDDVFRSPWLFFNWHKGELCDLDCRHLGGEAEL